MSSTDSGKHKDGMISLSYPMLTLENYTVWAMKMRVKMQAHGVWVTIDPEGSKGTVADKIDKTVMAVIYHSVLEDILLTLAEKKTAKEAWEAVKMLCQRAERVKQARIQTLKAEESVVDAYVVKKLLRDVPGKFLQIASTIEQFGNVETMTVEETVGSLKAYEERLRGKNESGGQKLLLTEEEWNKRENEDRNLLLTSEEWLKRSGGNEGQRSRGRDMKWVKDKSKVRCFNCSAYGYFSVEYKKTRKDRETKEEALIAQVPDEEPALLMMKCNEEKVMLFNEEGITPTLNSEKHGKSEVSNLWYLDNGASIHMSRQ
ncbi:uncharacterized protein LOC141660226 [Apium graveolens]|uniref:uncharacterized protein LOC141660226 n=1 Tax=Apium graveolens TaxID=4045 RepID=UPI003D79C34D